MNGSPLTLFGDLLGKYAPAQCVPTPADVADSADTRALPSFPELRTLADSCGHPAASAPAAPAVRKHPQPSANAETRATPSDPQNPQRPQPSPAQCSPGELAELRTRLHGIAKVHGIAPEIVQVVATDEAVSFCMGMTDAELTRWANIVCTREAYRQGLLKHGWAIPSAAHVQGAA